MGGCLWGDPVVRGGYCNAASRSALGAAPAGAWGSGSCTQATRPADIEALWAVVAVKALAVRIEIDDFGTGYSSLAHLQRFPVGALKIDRCFISALSSNDEGETLIHWLVQLGKAL